MSQPKQGPAEPAFTIQELVEDLERAARLCGVAANGSSSSSSSSDGDGSCT